MYFAMSENIISSAEAEGLLRKIETEHIPIRACFVAEESWRATINGFVRTLTKLDCLSLAMTIRNTRYS